jgi:hypothetical protein
MTHSEDNADKTKADGTAKEKEKDLSIDVFIKIAEMGIDTVKKAVEFLENAKKQIDEKNSKKIFTYAECVKYFVSHKNDSHNIAKGAVLKKEIGKGSLELMLFFLDKNGNLLFYDDQGNSLGFKTIRAGLDSELENLFRGNDLLIVE